MSIGPKLEPLLASRCLYLGVGVHLTAGQPDPKTNQMSCWPDVLLLLVNRCLYRGMSDWMSAWPKGSPNVKLTWCSTALVTRCHYQGVHLTAGQVAEGPGAWPHWAPVQGPSTPTGSLGGVTYLTKARQVTQMSFAACYIPLALCLVTICSFVSMLPNHIFLHAM